MYAPTNKKDNVAEVDKFYDILEMQVKEVRTKYGAETKIVILGDFNARVGVDGADNMTEERNEADEMCVNGTFGFEETDDNILRHKIIQGHGLILRTDRWRIWDLRVQLQYR